MCNSVLFIFKKERIVGLFSCFSWSHFSIVVWLLTSGTPSFCYMVISSFASPAFPRYPAWFLFYLTSLTFHVLQSVSLVLSVPFCQSCISSSPVQSSPVQTSLVCPLCFFLFAPSDFFWFLFVNIPLISLCVWILLALSFTYPMTESCKVWFACLTHRYYITTGHITKWVFTKILLNLIGHFDYSV